MKGTQEKYCIPFHQQVLASGVAIGVRRGVAAFEPDLVHAHGIVFQEKPGIELHALAAKVDFGDPALDAVWVELVVPRRIERVAEVRASAVAAEFHHLWTAV